MQDSQPSHAGGATMPPGARHRDSLQLESARDGAFGRAAFVVSVGRRSHTRSAHDRLTPVYPPTAVEELLAKSCKGSVQSFDQL